MCKCFHNALQTGVTDYIIIGIIIFLIYSFFSPIPIVLVATILSHRYNSLVRARERQRWNAMHPPKHNPTKPHCSLTQPGSQPHQCIGGNTVHLATLVSVHCARPATGVAGAWWDKDIPTGQTLPNPDDARPIVRRCARAWARTQGLCCNAVP